METSAAVAYAGQRRKGELAAGVSGLLARTRRRRRRFWYGQLDLDDTDQFPQRF
ncbi:hypothetical protein AB0J90_30905 [Micromonospora sp. NPDC049523]|uniref:hypothetical protein n=1 Tax=Micromonospora sp. NPDC049523 TaxID=3155921 RepID=UPI0034213642